MSSSPPESSPSVEFAGHAVVYTDAAGIGGAEISLGHLVASAPASARITVVGTCRTVVEAIAARRSAQHAALSADSVIVNTGRAAVIHHWRAFHRLRPDIIHLNLCTPWAAAAALTAALAQPARVVRVDQLPLRTTDLLTLLRTRLLSLRVDAHVAVGQGAARLMEDFYALGRGSILSIPNGVPDRSPGAVPPRCPVQAPLQVGSVGRLDPMKGHDVLLRAIAQVPNTALTILGEGDWRAHLEQLAQTLGIAQRVSLPGWVDPQAYLPRFDVVAQPSRSEGFPLAVVEAMLAARPVVATRVGSVAEAVVHGKTGLLIEKNDAAGLAAALQHLQRDGVAQRMGQQGRAIATASFTSDRMASAYVALWQRLCAQPAAPRIWVGRPKD